MDGEFVTSRELHATESRLRDMLDTIREGVAGMTTACEGHRATVTQVATHAIERAAAAEKSAGAAHARIDVWHKAWLALLGTFVVVLGGAVWQVWLLAQEVQRMNGG